MVFSGGANFHTVTGTNTEPFCGSNLFTVCSVTFSTLGTFDYFCIPHRSSGMTGVVHVVSGETSPLTVVIHGQGTVTPNFNGQQLLIGNTYTVTAIPAQGFAFVNWTGGTNSSTARLTFTMQSNLVLEANFVDTLRPTLVITSPPPNARLTNGTLTLSGTARDNGDVAVEYRVETAAGTNDYQVASGTTNWSVVFSDLAPGAYRFRARARDTAGNLSPEATRSVQILAPLTVTTNGNGTIGGGFAGTTFREVGRRLSIPAFPKPGSLFSNWTGSIVSTTNPLVFVMRSNTVFQANFVINPFLPLKGSFNGLFFVTNAQIGVQHESSGFVTLALTDRGRYSGNVQLAGKRHPFSGQFTLEGKATNSVKRPGTNELSMELMLDLNGGSERVMGQLVNATAGWSAELKADHAPVYTGTNASPYQGKYTLLMEAAADAGNSFGRAQVNAKGKLTFQGTLADGTPITQSTTVSRTGDWPLYIALYGGKGSILSEVTVVTDPPPAALTGEVTWTKPALPAAKYYPAGFTNTLALEGSLYQPPGTNKVLQIDTGMVRFKRGGLSGAFTNLVTLGGNNKVTNLTTNQPLIMNLTLPLGLLNGTLTLTNDGVRTKLSFKGALLQPQDFGAGFFLGSSQSGRVRFETAP